MKQELMDAIQETPVIAAVKDDAGLCNALTNENIRVIFVLYGDICNIASIVRRIHEAGRFAAVQGNAAGHLHREVLHAQHTPCSLSLIHIYHPKVRFDDSILYRGTAAYTYMALRWLSCVYETGL